MTATIATVEPRMLSVADAKAVLADVTAMKNMTASLEGRLARRIADASDWERAGYASPELWLATQTGTSPGRAKEALETARRMEAQPEVADAAERGELSPEQAAAVADAAEANPGAARLLVAKAKALPLGKLRDECARAKRAADLDPEATHARLKAARSVRFCRALDGAARMFAGSTAEQLAVVKAAVERRGNQLFDEARRAGRREQREAYLMDALEQICREWLDGDGPAIRDALDPADGDEQADQPAAQPGSRSSTWLGLLRIDLVSLRRGAVEGEETCEIAGLGPIPVSIARALLGESVLKLVITRGVDVLNVTHLGRGPTAAQRIALLWNSPGCSVTGCGRMAGIEVDHTADWTTTRHTVLGELQRLCDHHHDLKTHHRWAAIRAPDGTVVMIPPDDPRHPSRHRRAPQVTGT